MRNSQECNVYLWLDNNVPFYVGIGSKTRSKCRKHNKQAEGRRKRAEASNTFTIQYVFTGSRASCEEIESFLISCYGSIIAGGILFNFTPGGDGLKGKDYLSEESLNKIIEGGRKGGYASKPTQKVHTLGGKAQGKKNVESGHIGRLAESNSKEWSLIDPSGNVITFRNLQKFCRENNLSPGNMGLVLSGKRSHHKGYRRNEY
jgi:hypothetical protein